MKPGCKYVSYEHMDVRLPVYRQHLTRSVICMKRVKPVLLLVAKVGRSRDRHNGVQVWEDGLSECPPVTGVDRVSIFDSGESRAEFHLVISCKKTMIRPLFKNANEIC
jgi:hypothetical protein